MDGSVMATHSDDGESNPDARVVYVPAMDHAPGATRPIYYDTEDFPRFVGDRGVEAYLQKNNPGFNASVPIGHIPQVEHTFGYFEATYGILNEHQVGIGESTCSSVFGAQARGHGGHALFSVDSLSRIALERSKSAREAVQLMGDLAVAEGFYGAGSARREARAPSAARRIFLRCGSHQGQITANVSVNAVPGTSVICPVARAR